jgi:hypothetical protein
MVGGSENLLPVEAQRRSSQGRHRHLLPGSFHRRRKTSHGHRHRENPVLEGRVHYNRSGSRAAALTGYFRPSAMAPEHNRQESLVEPCGKRAVRSNAQARVT